MEKIFSGSVKCLDARSRSNLPIGHDVGEKKQVKVLNGIITVTTTGFEHEPDIRHTELTMQELDVCCNSVKTPWSESLRSSALDEESSNDGHRRFNSRAPRRHRPAIRSEGMCSKDGAANDVGLVTTELSGTIFARMPWRSHLVSVPRCVFPPPEFNA